MTHIANCMRRGFDKLEVVYIMGETPSTSSALLTDRGISRHLGHETVPPREDSLSLVPSRVWPRPPSRAQELPLATFFVNKKDMALATRHSSNSLTDTAATKEIQHIWRRGGSLSRRRNISVPELTGKFSDKNLNLPNRGYFMDSPTIPGRPPLEHITGNMVRHERSSSAPGTWRDCAFGDAMTSCVEWPSVVDESGRSTTPRTQWASVPPIKMTEKSRTLYHPTRPLSPILSPVEGTTPTTAVHISPFSPRFIPDIPPQVPPKHSPVGSSPAGRKGFLTSKVSRPWLRKTPSKNSLELGVETIGADPSKLTKRSHEALKVTSSSPKAALKQASESLMLANSPPTSASSSPTGKVKEGGSPTVTFLDETSVTDRDKAIERSLKRMKSQPVMSKPSTPQSLFNVIELPPLCKPAEQDLKSPQLPTGLRPKEALTALPEHEKALLRKQATSQAEQFEILGAQHVSSLSRELRALDERCDYLRKTYKSLRSGRQKLHTRMISYLKSESLIFSRERLLQQQEALIELDNSIDDWVEKLERAENRRLRLRQKLLEHVAGAMALTMAHHSAQQLEEPTTPPRSPAYSLEVVSPKPLRLGRKGVESIKIYADNQVLNLFNDIEQVVEKMCESC